MAHERTRIDDERAQKEQRERDQAAERAARERSRNEEEALRAARERDRLLEEDRRRREEEARLDGIRTAEVTRVRDEAARKAELESALFRREHELKLESIRQVASARVTRFALVGTSAATLVLGALLGWLELGVNPARLAKLDADTSSITRGERERADRAEGLLKTSEAARRELAERLRVVQDVATPPAPTTAPPPRTPSNVRPRGPGRPGVTKPPCVDDGDPLNPCLKRSL